MTNSLKSFADDIFKAKHLICIPKKSGSIIFLSLSKSPRTYIRFLLIIGPLVISSVSGVWWKHT